MVFEVLYSTIYLPHTIIFKDIRVQPFEIDHQKQVQGLTHCTSEENHQTSS
jgi:hypothetical protein